MPKRRDYDMSNKKHNLVPRIDIPKINVSKAIRDTTRTLNDAKVMLETAATVIGIVISIKNTIKK